jgi:peptide methionine sulfoxide reductase msrA/msrB
MKTNKLILAGGCFWCTQADIKKLNGVISAISGYIGGNKENPTYEEICSQDKRLDGIKEAVEVTYNTDILTLKQILEYYFLHIDPTTENQQFCDIGVQYQTAVFYNNLQEKNIINEFIDNLNNLNVLPDKVKTQVLPVSKFWPAEEYHQDFYLKNPVRYNNYKAGSGREVLAQIWKKYLAKKL